jgi:hypothetical protein
MFVKDNSERCTGCAKRLPNRGGIGACGKFIKARPVSASFESVAGDILWPAFALPHSRKGLPLPNAELLQRRYRKLRKAPTRGIRVQIADLQFVLVCRPARKGKSPPGLKAQRLTFPCDQHGWPKNFRNCKFLRIRMSESPPF